jgi:hypothetical protein
MRTRDLLFGIGGTLLGAVLVLILSSAGVLPLSGTAGITPASPPAYFLVEMDDAQEWLSATFPAEVEQLTAAFASVDALRTTQTFADSVRGAQNDISYLTARSFTALTGLPAQQSPNLSEPLPVLDPLPVGLLPSLSDGDVSSCLGIDENPYNLDGYTLYLNVELPQSQVASVPESWLSLDAPIQNDLFWQLLDCQRYQRGGSSASERPR